MLTAEMNELVTKVGASTPGGEMLRRYWMPALLDWELPEPDCPPVRVRLLGEELVAFRDTDGRVGLVQERCPHRRASLWFGRNEEGGLRCVYHGWKYDVAGKCLDQMNEPVQFRDKIHLVAYPTHESGGVIWAYMGPADEQPPPPSYAFTSLPAEQRHMTKVHQECNWLQGLEGGLDTSHAQILHREFTDGISKTGPGNRGGAPRVDVDWTDYGYRYAGVYNRRPGVDFVRTYQFIMPFHQMRAGGPESDLGRGYTNSESHGHMWVPMDDDNTMVWNLAHSLISEPVDENDPGITRLGNDEDNVDQTTFRSHANLSNDFMIDRERQRNVSFTGIEGVNVQDRAIQETMGPILDRSEEHLGPADKAIIELRKMLIESVRTVQEGGRPRGTHEDYSALRPLHGEIPDDTDWRDAFVPLMSASMTLESVSGG